MPLAWPANVPTGLGWDSFNERRSQTKTRPSSEPLRTKEFDESRKRTALTSFSWAVTYIEFISYDSCISLKDLLVMFVFVFQDHTHKHKYHLNHRLSPNNQQKIVMKIQKNYASEDLNVMEKISVDLHFHSILSNRLN